MVCLHTSDVRSDVKIRLDEIRLHKIRFSVRYA